MNAENYALAWSAHLTEIKSGLVALQEQCQMQDVTLAADGQHVNAHKLVLAICSDYFRDVFSANPTNSTHAIVILKDISHTALSYIIQFMYTGEISIPADTLTEFLTAARVLRVKGLMSGEEKIIKDKHQVPQLKPKRKAPSQVQPITNLKYRPGPKSRKTTKRVVTYGSKPSKTYPKPIIDSSNIKVEKEDLDDVPSGSSVPDIKPDLDNNMSINYEYNGNEGSLNNDVDVANEMDSQGEAVDESCYTNGPGCAKTDISYCPINDEELILTKTEFVESEDESFTKDSNTYVRRRARCVWSKVITFIGSKPTVGQKSSGNVLSTIKQDAAAAVLQGATL